MKLSLGSLLPGHDRGWKSMYPVCGLASCSNKFSGRPEPHRNHGGTGVVLRRGLLRCGRE
jgi:hypothetical protein